MKRTQSRRRAAVVLSSLAIIGTASVAGAPSLGCSGDLRDLWSCDALAHAECSKWKDCGTITDEDACYESVRHTLESTLGKSNYTSGNYEPGDARGNCLDKVDDSSKCLDDIGALACSKTGAQAVPSCNSLAFNTAVAPSGLASGSGNGSSSDAFKVCAPTNEVCTTAELAPYQQCIIDSCASLFTTCLGSNFRTGAFSGVCADYYSCSQKCDCNDTSCTSKCTASSACSTCLTTNASKCSSTCAPPTCSGTGTGTGTTSGLGAGFVGTWTGSVTNHICQNTSTNPQCFSGTVEFELDLSDGGNGELQAVMPTSYSQNSGSGENGCASIPVQVISTSVANADGQSCTDQGVDIDFSQFELTLQTPNTLVIDIQSTQSNNGGMTMEYTGTLTRSSGSH